MRIKVVAALAAAAVAGACSNPSRPPTAPESISVPVQFETEAHASPNAPHNHRTHMTGDEEVPPNDSKGQGQTIFQVSRDGQSVSFRLIASNIENITQAHIHCGPAGVNGPVIVWLYPAPPAPAAPALIPGRHDGVLSTGTFTNAHVIPRPSSAACPGGVANLADVLAKIRAREAYVNVHTSQFPPGEIRGQID
jgi:hypothetical protein